MHKAQRNKPLSSRQKSANKRISKTRYIVEQCFGTMKRLFGMSRASFASYSGTKKVNAQFALKRSVSICAQQPTKFASKPSRCEQFVRSACNEANAVRNPLESGLMCEKSHSSSIIILHLLPAVHRGNMSGLCKSLKNSFVLLAPSCH